MAHPRTTGKKVASKASSQLRSNRTTKNTKSVAGSALSQKHGKKVHKGATVSKRPPKNKK